ncbi:hypothetical protein T265_13797, partial [Opisthorchis viverrini]
FVPIDFGQIWSTNAKKLASLATVARKPRRPTTLRENDVDDPLMPPGLHPLISSLFPGNRSFEKFRASKPAMPFRYLVSRSLSYAAHSRPFYPAVAEYGPKRLDNLIPGKVYLWCACGLSKSQPWCDGSHKPTHFRPLRWVVPAAKPDSVQASSHFICQCKYSSTPPLCDSTHNQLHQEVADRQTHCSCSHAGNAPQYILPDGQRTFCDRCGNVTSNVPS